MAYKIIRDLVNEYQTGREIVAILDADADVANLPTALPGSTAIVAAQGGNVYMVNASGSWEVL